MSSHYTEQEIKEELINRLEHPIQDLGIISYSTDEAIKYHEKIKKEAIQEYKERLIEEVRRNFDKCYTRRGVLDLINK